MTLRWDVVQGEQAWLDLRAGYIGGSEIAGLFGVQQDWGMSRFTLHMVKSGRIKAPEIDDSPGSRIWFGKRKERLIAEMAAELFGWKIRPGPYAIDDACEGMAASLDFVIDEPGDEEARMGFEGPGYLEIKLVDFLVHRREWTGGEPPFSVLLQHQHGLACSGYGWGVIVCEIGGNELRAYRYASRPRNADMIREKVAEFWAAVREDRVPNTDGTDSTAQALRDLYATVRNTNALDLSDNDRANDACVNFITASANNRESKRRYDEAKNEIEELLKGNVFAQLPGFEIRAATTPEKPDRVAKPGEIIKGRAETRRLSVKEVVTP
jgi:predicted phage-related endonuclease